MQQNQTNNIKPRDGPATAFEADPIVSDIFTCNDGDYFGLVLVTNWPPPIDFMDKPYQKFLTAVRTCFNRQDFISNNSESHVPAVYLYPTVHLHITLATFIRPRKIGHGDKKCQLSRTHLAGVR